MFFDVETVGEHRGVPHLNTVTWMGLATDGLCVSVPFGHPIGTREIGSHKVPTIQKNGRIIAANVVDYEAPPPQIRPDIFWEIVRPLFLAEWLTKVAHGASFDLASVPKHLGFQVARPFACNIVLDWLINENRHAYGLKIRTKQLWGVEYEDKGAGKEIEKVPFASAARYLYTDTRYGWLQYKRNRPQIEAQDLEEIYELELNILEILVGMRQTGAAVDVAKLTQLRETLRHDQAATKERLFDAAGCEFNLGSVPQRQRILFGPRSEGGQGLKAWKLTDGARKRGLDARSRDVRPTDFSTDDESLEGFAGNPVVDNLRDYQDTSKLLSTYVESWLGVDPDPEVPGDKGRPSQIYDGRIYADFVQYGTVTGRFSCRAPNLQNIPRGDKEHGKMLRDSFWAELDWLLAVADYGQIEPRLMAHYLGCGMLYEGFLNGMDPYIVNASAALGKDPEDVTKGERQTYGKTMFLAMGYGLGVKGLASKFRVSEDEARKTIQRHEKNMPEVAAYKEALIRSAKRVDGTPFIRTLLGRKRRVPELLSKDNYIRARAERQLFNSQIQGGAADLMKLAMWRTYCNLKGIPGARISLTVHDELALTGPKDFAQQLRDALSDGMAGPGIQKLVKVPLKADVEIGTRWGDLH